MHGTPVVAWQSFKADWRASSKVAAPVAHPKDFGMVRAASAAAGQATAFSPPAGK